MHIQIRVIKGIYLYFILIIKLEASAFAIVILYESLAVCVSSL